MKPPPRLRAWWHMGQSAAMRRLDPTWLPDPHVAYLLVTFRCTGRCLTCNAWRITGHDELALTDWKRILRQAPHLDVVKILGGEPFVREDILPLLEAVRETLDPYILQLTTNGMMTDAILETVRRVGWPGLQLRVSIDGTQATHDAMRGVPGCWAQADRTLHALAELRPRIGFGLGINFALKDASIGEADAMMAYAGKLGADLIPGVNVEPFLDGSIPPEIRPQRFVGLTSPERALPLFDDRKAGFRRQLPGMDRILSRSLVSSTFRRQLRDGQCSFVCRSLRDILYVLPNGDVTRCGMDHAPVGNLRTHSVQEIWQGEAAREMRSRVDRCPGCLQASMQILSRFYAGTLFGPPAPPK